jgi:class 3 adenylate cyclase/CHASE2 domain-containing sensor protein
VKKLKHLQHILVTSMLSLTILFGSIMMFSGEFSNSINWFFVYRTGTGVTGTPVWQDMIYTHTLEPSGNIALITIDEATLNEFQSKSDQKMLTIPKSVYRDLVDKLEWASVAGIGFDIIFQNTDPEEASFVETMKRYDNIVIAQGKTDDSTCTTDSDTPILTCAGVPRSIYRDIPWGTISIEDIYRRSLTDKLTGTAATWKDTSTVKPLSLTLAHLTNSGNTTVQKLYQNREKLILTPFFGPPGVYARVSLKDVIGMSRATLYATFHGKYIFIGESGTLIHDSFESPVTGTLMDGVETHAHFLDGLLQDKMLSRFDYDFVVFALLTLVMSLLYFYIPSYLSPVLAAVMMVVILWISRYLYDQSRILVDIFPLFLAGGLLTFPMTFIYRFFVVDREKHFIENAFGHYIDPKMVKMIDMEEVEATLGGEQKEVTVFFSDIAGFTTISEKLGTQELFYLMSAYLSRETDILIGEWGTLDKYIGDAVMGFFGAPVAQPDHAMRACRTALAMRAGLPEFNREIQSRGIDPINFRVGIATGEVMVGNIGSIDHFNYTVLGDTVNLASRLEATGKEYGVHIIISEKTKMQIGDGWLLRELDTIAVKWKTEGIRIYELLGTSENALDMSIYTQYEEALALYRSGSYLEAGRIWESQMQLDPPSEIMALRCVEILSGKLVVEGGVYKMLHK